MHTRQQSIQSFGRVGKANGVTSASTLAGKLQSGCQQGSGAWVKSVIITKRKLDDVIHEEEPELETREEKSDKRQRLSKARSTTTDADPTPRTPQTVARFRNALPTPETTPTKATKSASTSTPRSPSKYPALHVSQLDTPPTTPTKPVKFSTTTSHPISALPDALEDLQNLHASFLKALVLHLAHNGPATPVDIRILTPSVARIWKQRRVTADDILRSIGVMQQWYNCNLDCRHGEAENKLVLYDYGGGKICIEFARSVTTLNSVSAALDEDAMRKAFNKTLQELWDQEAKTCAEEDVSDFIGRLPLAKVLPYPGRSKTKQMHIKGQQRLDELKGFALSAQKTTSSTYNQAAKTKEAVSQRSQGLLERMKAKSAIRAETQPQESKECLERRAALHRLPELVAMLSVHRGGAARETMLLQAFVQNVQDSARVPIGREEVERALNILVADLAPEWVVLSTIGKVVGVVVDHARKPNDLDVRMRRALAEC